MSALQGWTIQVTLSTIGLIVADHIVLDIGFALNGLVASSAIIHHYLRRQ